MRRHLHHTPQDRTKTLEAIRQRHLPWFPYQNLNHHTARRLLVSYCFTPYTDPSGVVSAKRTRERGEVIDVVCNAMDDVRDVDPGTEIIAQEYLDQVVVLTTPSIFGRWSAVRDFCTEGMAALDGLVEKKGRYESMHSRAMWPASHFLAALYKIDNPGTAWTAEFSDPISHDVHGAPRPGEVPDDALARRLRAALPRSFVGHDLSLFQWCEQIAYHLADELLFTNQNQLRVMVEQCPPQLRDQVRAKAVVSPQPVLPERFYRAVEVEDRTEPGVCTIGYFGAFYATRGLGEILDALSRLDADTLDRLRLDIFTGGIDAVQAALRGKSYARAVRVFPYRPYLEFLALTTRYDVLLVNHGITAPGQSLPAVEVQRLPG
jgi:poly(ribitol-phosphate) beta-N-acetylglucosaminyltransferase